MQAVTQEALLLKQASVLGLTVAGMAAAFKDSDREPGEVTDADVEFTITTVTEKTDEQPAVYGWLIKPSCPNCFKLIGRRCRCVDEPVSYSDSDD